MLPEGNWIIARADAQAQSDPAGQGAGRRRPRPVPVLGRRDAGHSRDQLFDALHSGKAKYSSIFNYPTLTWADIGTIGWLVDGAAIMNQVPICRCSYGPYARAMVRICKEESFHQRQGFEILLTLMRGHAGAARDGAGRGRTAGGGRPDDVRPARRRSRRTRRSRCAGASSASATTSCARSSSTRRCRRPRMLGVTLPDPDLRWNEERGHYDFGADRLERVLGRRQRQRAVQQERLAARVKAHGRRRSGCVTRHWPTRASRRRGN